ncbi:LemA family protein [Mesomycoplasma neurolyticum]|uniref:LemA family n=1 Tax=Mesomycoplasma neurolyticum TaxID=2120 RepID=A0A449A4L1_9BACT|nr:LemA family protein [Mesomycoplasma neurolyticum]VEU59162.1 LemA family [Mesomycoplasma neurolyticum]
MKNQINQLDSNNINNNGKQIHVINKTLSVKVSKGTIIFFNWILWFLFIIPGIIFLTKKIKAKKELDWLQQNIQRHTSLIDNFLEQKYNILENVSKLLEKAINLDKEIIESVTSYRYSDKNIDKNEMLNNLENLGQQMNLTFEKYPELKAHKTIINAMQQNSYLQQEITAACQLYNDIIYE